MGKTYAVQITTLDPFGEPSLVDRTVVYADTDYEARINGASILNVEPHQVDVVDLDAPVPTDAEMEAMKAEAQAAVPDVPDYMRDIYR